MNEYPMEEMCLEKEENASLELKTERAVLYIVGLCDDSKRKANDLHRSSDLPPPEREVSCGEIMG